MQLLEQYVENFNSNDSKKFAATFTEDCIFCDTAPTSVGMDPMYVAGRECVDMIFNMYFSQMKMEIKPVEIRGNVLDYIVCYPGFDIPCRGTVLEEREGKIARYQVNFRQ